jgi:hypothetical protein
MTRINDNIGTKWAGVDFCICIEKSFESLEKAALSRRPGNVSILISYIPSTLLTLLICGLGLRHRDHRSIRDYMEHLRKAFPSLSVELCNEYTATYERAVFSEAKFTFDFNIYKFHITLHMSVTSCRLMCHIIQSISTVMGGINSNN